MSGDLSQKLRAQNLPLARLYQGLNDWAFEFPKGDPDLWSVQNEALQGLRNVIPAGAQKGNYAFYFHMFTGTGKTRLAIKAIELMAKASDGSVPKTIIRAPTRFRVKEILEEIKMFAPHLVDQVGLYYSHERDPYKQIIITTFPGFAKGTAEGFFGPKDVDLIVTDEMHEGLSERRLDDVDPFARAVKIGLTATPDYSADRSVANHYQLAYKLDHLTAIERKIISPFRNVLLRSETNLDDVVMAPGGDYDLATLARKANTKARNQTGIKFYRDFVEPTTGQRIMGRQALAFCVDIDHAKDFAEQSNDALQKFMPTGVKFCEAVWGEHPDLQRVLDDYASGKIMCLSNADLLTRAYNQPRAAICLNLAPSRSAVVVGQRPGRVLRSDENKPFAIIAEIVDETTNPENMPLLYAEYLNGAAFGTIFKDDPEFIPPKIKAVKVKDVDEDQSEITLKQVLVTREEVMAYLHDRRLMREDLLRTGVINDTVLPILRAKMTERGIENIYQLWMAVKDQLPLKAEQRAFDDYVPTLDRFGRICTGVTSAWDLRKTRDDLPVPTLEAFIISAYFKMGTSGVSELFGSPKGRVLIAEKTDLPYSREQHERFIKAMTAAGYTGHGAFSKLRSHLVVNKDSSTTVLSNLARGQISPVLKSTGAYSSLAQEVALLLNRTEAELFGEVPELPVWDPDPDTSAKIVDEEGNYDVKPENAEPPVLQLTQSVFENPKTGKTTVTYGALMLAETEDVRKQGGKDLTKLDKVFIHKVIDSLTPRERMVMRMRFGIRTNTDYSREEVAKHFDVTVERIRQIEAKALRKLKHPSRLAYPLRLDNPEGHERQEQSFDEAWRRLWLTSLGQNHVSPYKLLTLMDTCASYFRCDENKRCQYKDGQRKKVSFVQETIVPRKNLKVCIDRLCHMSVKTGEFLLSTSLNPKELIQILECIADIGLMPTPEFFKAWQDRLIQVSDPPPRYPHNLYYTNWNDFQRCMNVFAKLGIHLVDRIHTPRALSEEAEELLWISPGYSVDPRLVSKILKHVYNIDTDVNDMSPEQIATAPYFSVEREVEKLKSLKEEFHWYEKSVLERKSLLARLSPNRIKALDKLHEDDSQTRAKNLFKATKRDFPDINESTIEYLLRCYENKEGGDFIKRDEDDLAERKAEILAQKRRLGKLIQGKLDDELLPPDIAKARKIAWAGPHPGA